MGQVVRAPIYVPKPAEDAPWVGKPRASALVLLAALVVAPTFFLGNTNQVRPAEETGWTGRPSGFSAALAQITTQQFTGSTTRKFDHVPESYWVEGGGPVPLVLAQLPAQPSFTVKGTRRFDYVPEPGWLGEPTPVSIAITLAPQASLPFSNPRRFELATEIPGFKSIPFTVPLTPQAVLPFFNARRTSEHAPEPIWLGKPQAAPGIILQSPPVVLPFANSPWKGPIPDPNWVAGGGSIPQALLQFPAVPPFTAKGTRRFDHVPEPIWLGEPEPVSIIYTLPPAVALPFINRPWQGPIAPPDWVEGGGAVSQVLLQFPAVPLFTARGTQRFDNFIDPVWRGRSGAAPLSLTLSPASTPSVTTRGTRSFIRPDDTIWTPRNSSRSGTIFLSTHFAVRTQTRPNEPVYLLDVQVYNPITTLIEIKRFSTVTITTRPDDSFANTIYDGRMINAGEIKRQMFENGATIGKATTSVGYFQLNNADGALDYLLDYGVAGWSFTLKVIADREDYVSTATTVFVGTMRGWQSPDARKVIWLRIRDKMETLKLPLLTTRYAGTTNSSAATAEGDSTMSGKLKPYSIGTTYQCPTEPANSYDLIYQGSNTSQAAMIVYDGGSLLTQDADYASIALLRAAVVPAGSYGTALALGLIRLGALPAKTVNMLMQSSATTANLSAGAVAQQILLDGGAILGDIDTASFAALTSASGNWEVGLFVNDEKTVIDAVCQVLNNVAATLVSTAAGKFKAVSIGSFPDSFSFNPIFQDETAVDTYTNDDLSDNSQFVLQASPQAEGDGAPAYAVNVKFKPKWQTLSSGDLVSGLSPAFVADAAKKYRELAQGNLAIKTAQPLAQFLNVETLHAASPGAIILGERLFDFYSKRRDYLTFDLSVTRAGTVDLGDIVLVKPTDGNGNARYGYGSGGKKMCIIGRHDQFGIGKVTLTAWG